LAISFTTDLASIESSQVQSDLPLRWKQDGSNAQSWLLFGDSTFSTGIAMFVPDTVYEVGFLDLENVDGKVQSSMQSVRFQTLPVLDKDFSFDSNKVMQDNNQPVRADMLADSAHFFNGTALASGVTFAGVIAGAKGSLTDDVDWFSVWMYVKDTIDLELSDMHEDLDLVFQGPANANDDLYDGSEFDIDHLTGTKTESASLAIPFTAQDWGVDGDVNRMGRPLRYWIGVKEGSGFKARSAYVLTIKIRKFKTP